MRAANTRAKNFYQLAFVEEDIMEEEEKEEKLNNILGVKENTIAAEKVRSGKWDEGRRRNLVGLLLKQENITDI